MRFALTLIVVVSLAATVRAQSHGQTSAKARSTALRLAPPRYQVRWPSSDVRWRLTWSGQDRVTLTWNP